MKYYIDANKELFGIEQGQEFLVKSDWTECITQEDGLPYSKYNVDGTPDLDVIEQERVANELTAKIAESKSYLTDTSWIWEKYNRNVLVLKDMTNEEFNLKYSDVISKQEEYRALINELEVQLEVTNG